MSDFTFDKKENYSLEEVESLLKQHRNVVYAESKKDIEPKLSEYQIKLKEYETKVNQYEEKELFNGFNDKQKEISFNFVEKYGWPKIIHQFTLKILFLIKNLLKVTLFSVKIL